MLKRFIVCGLLIWLLPSGAATADSVFPKFIRFKVTKGLASGSFDLSFGEDIGSVDKYVITLKNFEGLGVTSKQQLWSLIFKQDLSLYGHLVTEGENTRNPISSVFLNDDCKSALGRTKTKCFLYKGREQGEAIQTEIFTPYRAIDLVSSIVVATNEGSSKTFSPRDFNFIFEKRTRQVTLEKTGNELLETPLGKRDALILALKLKDSDFELYRFYVTREKEGFYPAKMVFVDESATVEFVAETILWN
jgi:hypothetical protein